jgi:hypothetical protein
LTRGPDDRILNKPSSRGLETASYHPIAAILRFSHLWVVPLLVGLAVYAVAIGAARDVLNDGDTLSHIVIGRWIIEHRAIPFADPFSHTFRGQSWVPHEWLAELVLGAVYDRLGWGGVVAVAGLAAATAFALLAGALQRALGPRRAAIGAALAFLLTIPHLLARPHVLALPLLVVWTAGVVRARDEGRAPPLALLPVMVLWCNLHGGFVIGLLFAGLLAAEAVLTGPAGTRRRTVVEWGTFLVLAACAALISPNGVELYLLPWRMLGMSFATSTLSEWHSADFGHFQPLEIWIALAIFGGLSLGLRLPWTRTAMLLLLLHLALSHVRNAELLGIIGALLVATPLAAQLPGAEPPEPAPAGAGRWPRVITAAGVVGAALLVFLSTAIALDRRGIAPRGNVAPTAAVEAARRAGLDGPVLNSIRFGGYLMFAGIPTFIDGRADLFGDAFLAQTAAAEAGIGNALPELLDHYAITWTLFEPQSAAAGLLDHLPGWERVYADPNAVIHRAVRERQP